MFEWIVFDVTSQSNFSPSLLIIVLPLNQTSKMRSFYWLKLRQAIFRDSVFEELIQKSEKEKSNIRTLEEKEYQFLADAFQIKPSV